MSLQRFSCNIQAKLKEGYLKNNRRYVIGWFPSQEAAELFRAALESYQENYAKVGLSVALKQVDNDEIIAPANILDYQELRVKARHFNDDPDRTTKVKTIMIPAVRQDFDQEKLEEFLSKFCARGQDRYNDIIDIVPVKVNITKPDKFASQRERKIYKP